jgi:hypothetical protein
MTEKTEGSKTHLPAASGTLEELARFSGHEDTYSVVEREDGLYDAYPIGEDVESDVTVTRGRVLRQSQ